MYQWQNRSLCEIFKVSLANKNHKVYEMKGIKGMKKSWGKKRN